MPAKCYVGKGLYVEEQVSHADETDLFSKDVGKWIHRTSALVDENAVTRSSQEPNHVFPLGV